MKLSAALGLVIIFLGACAGIPKPSLVAFPEQELRLQVLKPRLHASIRDEQELRDTQSLIDETCTVIQSAEFIQNLVQLDGLLDKLWLSPFGETISTKEVAVAYLGIDPGHRPVPAKLRWGLSERTGPAEAAPDEAVIELSRSQLAQWRSDSVTYKSCAINTLAHELAHTVTRTPGQYLYLFTDRGRRWATLMGRPLASYTLGAVAQCTYLQQKRVLEFRDLLQCIQHWGTNNFYSSECLVEET
jgi:hypothetical protein